MNNADRFATPTNVDQVDYAFGGRMKDLLPTLAEIPDEYPNSEKYTQFQRTWFYSGIPKDKMPTAKPGIDFKAAMRHLGTIQGSFEPKHEHKEAAVAWLASRWLDLPGSVSSSDGSAKR